MPVSYVTQFGPESILYTKDEIIILMTINHKTIIIRELLDKRYVTI